MSENDSVSISSRDGLTIAAASAVVPVDAVVAVGLLASADCRPVLASHTDTAVGLSSTTPKIPKLGHVTPHDNF